ncbi:MAG: hypothetical protein IPJ47_22875 [Anaerolineales bacterium]|nr:hypothetical protein [Anaerolineales bacterium]
MEYWAFVWGALVMGNTGFMMWNPILATQFLPGEFVPAAKAAHGNEAVLCASHHYLAYVWCTHQTFQQAMFNGKMTETDMLHEHPPRLADIKAGIADRRPDAGHLAQAPDDLLPHRRSSDHWHARRHLSAYQRRKIPR